MANDLKISQQVLSSLENGKTAFTDEYLIQFAKYFNVSSDYLLGLTDIKTTDRDVNFVCEYTGLDENTVLTLNRVVKERNEAKEYEDSRKRELTEDTFVMTQLDLYDNFQKVTNDIILSNAFADCVHSLAFIYADIQKLSPFYIKLIQSGEEDDENFVKDSMRYLKMKCFEVKESFAEIAKQFCKPYDDFEEFIFLELYKIKRNFESVAFSLNMSHFNQEKREKLRELCEALPKDKVAE